jgi:predicted AAA+ superfamily ATPase
LNFERNPCLATLFNTNDPGETLLKLESEFNTSIDPKATLLFLDEIQAAPEIIAKLGWFKEDIKKP